MNKSVLILGTGNAQLDAVKYLKKCDYKVYGCSYIDGDVAQEYLDDFRQINIIDYEKVSEYAVEKNVDFVYSIGSDLAMPTVSWVSEKLNLPHFISSHTSYVCNNKDEMRSFLGNDFKGNTKFMIAETVEEAVKADFFPIMMKPVDSQGQRGVYKVNNIEQIREYFEKSVQFSKSKKVILEKYLEGDEVSVNCYLRNGVLEFALVSDRVSFDQFPGGIIKEHIIPSKYDKTIMKDKIVDLCQRVLNKLSILNGPAYFQIMVTDEGPNILEVTPRLDGCHMWNLIDHYMGVNLLERTFKQLTGDEISPIHDVRPSESVVLKFMCQAPESSVKYGNHQELVKDAEYLKWYYQEEENVKKMNGYMEKCGYVIVRSREK